MIRPTIHITRRRHRNGLRRITDVAIEWPSGERFELPVTEITIRDRAQEFTRVSLEVFCPIEEHVERCEARTRFDEGEQGGEIRCELDSGHEGLHDGIDPSTAGDPYPTHHVWSSSTPSSY